MKHWRNVRRLFVIALLAMPPSTSRGEPGDLIGYIPFATVAPQDIARDDDGSWWVTCFLDNRLYHYDSTLGELLEVFDHPFPGSYPTGIAFNSLSGTLLVTDVIGGTIAEIDKETGLATDLVIRPRMNEIPGFTRSPIFRGTTFDRTGNGGLGSIYVVEATESLIVELDLEGGVLRWFPHPDDPDGFPGFGRAAMTTDIDIIYDSPGTRITGFYVTGGQRRLSRILRLEPDGSYQGLWIPLEEPGGTVSGFLRAPFERPDTGGISDSFICVVESNPRFAILEGGEPDFHEIVNFGCTQAGREVEITWSSFQPYDVIDVSSGCEVLATLPGTAETWSHVFETDGVHELSIQARAGERSTPILACTVVVGGGQVLRSADVGGMFPLDIAATDDGILLVTDAREHAVLLFDREFQPLGSLVLGDGVAGEGEYMTGIAFAEETRMIFVFNASASRVAVLDEVGALTRVFDAKLPNLEEDPEADPDHGFVVGMTYDPAGNGGGGSLWVVETERDRIFEIDLEGNVLANLPHPYLTVDPLPPGTPFSISGGGIANVSWGNPGELLLTGGALYSQRVTHVFRMDKKTGEVVPGSGLPADGIRAASFSSSFVIDSYSTASGPRLVALSQAGRRAELLEVDARAPAVPAPAFLKARQPGQEDQVLLDFTPNGVSGTVEVYRDCEKVADLPPGATSFLDPAVTPGIHGYRLRAVEAGLHGDMARVSLRVGPGAVLERRLLWPARSPQQISQDPVDGSFAVAVNWPGDERKVFHFDETFRHVETRESIVDPEWNIAALAIRVPPGGSRELNYITWQQPVPFSDVNSQRFFLVRESLAGDALGEEEIFPPRPTNGFITYPTGLTWDSTRDRFYFLERNSRTFVLMSVEGDILQTFPHPSPPFQNFVFNLGLDFVPERGTLFILGSSRHDHRVTKVLEMTTGGLLTGLEIPLDGVPATITGIQVSGSELIAVGTGGFSEIFRLKAFPGTSRSFVRGDSDSSGSVNLTDVVVLLDHLFRGGPLPSCGDAADADDNGTLNLTDALAILITLFRGGGPLPAPYPEPGSDPTPDGLTCF
ncbi:MAG TPA: hypothetical protein VMT52_19540 [Planctomycetota bacterium]|nr:hypothetical protein [Planctomycetota bacterium]